VLLTGLGAHDAGALPLYARQTGQECAACHNGFPELTPYGRLFKLNGYTFPGAVPGANGTAYVPPLSAMVLASFNHTQTSNQTPLPYFSANDNPAIDQVSLFTGGKILDNLGAFVQGTYDGVGHQLHWDNMDVRYATSYQIAGTEMVSGISVNNNPTMSDVWNTTPAWRYPYVFSRFTSGSPPVATLVDGALAQRVVGMTAYSMWHRLLFIDAGAYDTFSKTLDKALGVAAPPNADTLQGLTPYWRLALLHDWGRNSVELGTFGLAASMYPGGDHSNGTNRYSDRGVDAQYQFLSDEHSLSFQGTYIDESQHRSADFASGSSSNLSDHLRSLNLKATYGYDQTYYATVDYFRDDGSADASLYPGSASGSPNGRGWTFELDYMPFNHGGPSFWPWANAKIGLQYTTYEKLFGSGKNYDGAGANADGQNTLYLFLWLAF
jgi:hypothetical protein